ncbi:MAG TPA: selenium-binding protein SBP56-related protein [Kofleriaceae bacterium]|nr:selenium-binding protein SBP56-related protein [Kofleriaceae bacterium]
MTRIQEKLLYVVAVEKTETGATASPDALFTVDVKPGSSTFGKVIKRTDMPNVGDELHHFGYDWDNRHLIINGLFSGRTHIVDVHTNARCPQIETVNSTLADKSGYVVPHTVIGLPNGNALVTMIGAAASGLGAPGGMIEMDARNGNFINNYGPAAARDYNAVGPKYMYDVGIKSELNRMVTTTFGLPKDVAPGIDINSPTLGLGNEVYVWDANSRQVIQRVDLGPGTGALEARWTNTYGEPVGYTNTPGTGAVWAWEDFDGNGVYQFHQVLTGLGLPTDIVMSSDSKYLYVADWGGGHVYKVNIQNRLNPVITATINIPHAQMMRLSQDDKRLYVTNSLLSSWDDDTDAAGPRNATYGLYLINTDPSNGSMALASNGNPMVDFTSIQKKFAKGRMRPHQIFFDPDVVWPFGFH